MATLPRLTLIGTGGTIAGAAPAAADTTAYRAGALDPAALLAAVPGAAAHATLDLLALLAIDSKDMSPSHWLSIARAVATRLAQPDCDGVVITHGTDTLEETAWFLHLVLPPGKPVVLTAAMRPASALSADGPMNLLQAIAVAASPAAHGKGVLVVLNDTIFAGADIVKTHTRALDAIRAPERGPLGTVLPVRFHTAPAHDSAGAVPLDTLAGRDALPRVDILYVAAGSDPDLLATAAARGTAGVVLALPGNGSLPEAWRAAADAATAAGVRVLRASRVAAGAVSEEAGALPASGERGPAKARIALMLALATGLATSI